MNNPTAAFAVAPRDPHETHNRGKNILMILNETYTLANEVPIPKLGLGTWFIDDDKAAQAVKDAVDLNGAGELGLGPCGRLAAALRVLHDLVSL